MNYNIPEYTLAALNRYVYNRVLPGGFLTAVLTNNLFEAVGRADSQNREALLDIVKYVYNEIPSSCWGSEAKVNEWVAGPSYPPEL